VVTLKLADPEIHIRRRRGAVLEPRSPVPKVSVDEHSEPVLSKGEVWPTEDPRVVSVETKSKGFERDGEPFFRLRLRRPHRPHDAAPRFLVEHVRHA